MLRGMFGVAMPIGGDISHSITTEWTSAEAALSRCLTVAASPACARPAALTSAARARLTHAHVAKARPAGSSEIARERTMMDLRTRLSDHERDELEALMDVRDPGLDGPMRGSITRVHGFLTSLVSGPMVMPSEWLPVIFHDPDEVGWESPKQAQRALSLIMRLHNEIASELLSGGRHYSIIVDRIGDGANALELADDWCRGYALGIAMREDEWEKALQLPELQDAF